MTPKTAIITLILILLVAVGMRSYQLPARSLWFDEAFSWRLIQFPWTEMVARDAQDVHPPFYYVVLKTWSLVFGNSVLALRAFSVTAAALTIIGVYLVARTAWQSPGTGVVAAWLTAIAGFQIQSAWEVRMYTLGTALVVWSAWLLLRAISTSKPRVGWWLAFAVVTTLAAYTHYYLLFSIMAEVIFLLGYFIVSTRGRIGEILQWRQFWYAVLAGVIIAGLYAPWLPTLKHQSAAVQKSFWIPDFTWQAVPTAVYHFFIPSLNSPTFGGFDTVVACIPFVLVVAMWLILLLAARPIQRPAVWLLLLLAIIPFVGSIGFSMMGHSVFQERYFIFSQIFILTAVAGFWQQLPWRSWRTVFLLGLSVGLLAADVSYWQTLDVSHKPGARAASQAVFAQRQSDEPVIVSSPFIYFSILHYATVEDNASPLPKLYSETGQLAHFAGGPILTTADVANATIFTQTDIKRVWAVDTTGFGGSSLPVPSDWSKGPSQSYPEVYGYQGVITITSYTRQ